MYNYLIILSVIFIFATLFSCNENEFPNHIGKQENLSIFHSSTDPVFNIRFEKEVNFGGNDDIYLGRFFSPVIDSIGRVYISDADANVIRIFDKNGNYLADLGSKGRGPGEFLSPPSLHIKSNKLYLYDALQLRFSVYSFNSLEPIKTIYLNLKKKGEIEELAFSNISRIYVRNDQFFMASFNEIIMPYPDNPNYNIEDDRYIRYILINQNGDIIPRIIFEQKDRKYLTTTIRGEFKYAAFPFLGRSLITVSDDGYIFSACSKEFLIEVHDPSGVYKYSFYYPFKKIPFSRDMAIRQLKNDPEVNETLLESFVNIIRNANSRDLPRYWPVLKEMIIDDKNRLWIATTVEDMTIYEWWVLEENGELITTFEWPRDEPIEVVKNGKLYTRHTDKETGLQQVVRFGIEME